MHKRQQHQGCGKDLCSKSGNFHAFFEGPQILLYFKFLFIALYMPNVCMKIHDFTAVEADWYAFKTTL